MLLLIDLFIWTSGVIGVKYSADLGHLDSIIIFENLTYFGVSFVAVHMLLMSITFTSTGAQDKKNRFIIYIVAILTQVIVWTNDFHHLFYQRFDYFYPENTVFGWYFFVHVIYSYICLLVAVFYLVKFAVKARGTTSHQAIVILIGTVFPIVVNICYTLQVEYFTIFSTPTAFMIMMLCYFFGVLRLSLFRLTPLAMKTVIDKTSDLYIVFDERMKVMDFNEPFYNAFSRLTVLKKNIGLLDALNTLNKTGVNPKDMVQSIKICQISRNPVKKEYELNFDGDVKFFSAEYTALEIDNEYFGCILMLKDITQATKDMEAIKKSQTMLIEKERLASLGQLIGGIAHNLKTPIMAISGRTLNLEALFDECEQSLNDESVTAEDKKEILEEMREEVRNIQNHMTYISEIITTVKEQTVKLNVEAQDSFTIEELLRRINILMKHELIRNNCELIYDIKTDYGTLIHGDINSLVQVVDNIILNAVYAYGGAPGKLWLTITQSRRDIIIAVRDNAGGMPDDIQEKLFKEMITSKGRDGTGLGLYMSYSTVVGKFEGKMWFKSVEGQGSEFFISIPSRT